MKATRNPRSSDLAWAVVNNDGGYLKLKLLPLIFVTRKTARAFCHSSQRVVRVRVTVEVVDGPR